jgi:hypothetical protein
MAELDPRSEGAGANSAHTTSADACEAGAAQANHVPPSADPAAASGPADDRSGLDRAEELVDHLAQQVSSLTSSWGRKVLRLGSRAREMAQDFWAEVQDFRQGKQP